MSGKILLTCYIFRFLKRPLYDHPDQVNYPGQKIYVVEALDYVYLVPFVRNDEGLFLKTIIPSRKAKKMYKGDNNV